MIRQCEDMENVIDAVYDELRAGIMPEAIPHCVACGSADIEFHDSEGDTVHCMACRAIESTVDWRADVECPAELADLWRDAPVIEPAYIITPEVYRMGEAA